MKNIEEKQILDEFKTQWKTLWRNRIGDKVRAEGIADKDYSMLFVDQGHSDNGNAKIQALRLL